MVRDRVGGIILARFRPASANGDHFDKCISDPEANSFLTGELPDDGPGHHDRTGDLRPPPGRLSR